MADTPESYLSFSNLTSDEPVVAYCSVCGMRFEADPMAGKRLDEQIMKVRAEFDVHSCSMPN